MSWIDNYYKAQEKLMRRQAELGQQVGGYGVERDTADLASLKAGQLPGTMTEDWQRQVAANRRKRQMMLGGARGTAPGTIANAMLTSADARGESVDTARMFESWRDQRRAALNKYAEGIAQKISAKEGAAAAVSEANAQRAFQLRMQAERANQELRRMNAATQEAISAKAQGL